ncbi:MAG: hypothetical protein KF773_20145 [Deltaproteobacteria bacterium]|nr:hypothetical protein [Deltaproteobacteria bacterium]MCW5805922.1 hypothetical protein [Deltaproteobacteria bacterium]
MGLRLRVPDVDDPDFVADVAYHEGPELRLVGSADSAALAGFQKLLDKLHEELTARGAREVVVDLQAADFLCAPCFKELVTWVQRLQDLPVEQRYRIRMRSNPSIAWQTHGLLALSCFDTEIITIETV